MSDFLPKQLSVKNNFYDNSILC